MGRSREEEFGKAPVPARPTLLSLRAAAAGCRACPLWRCGTQTVFGEGPARARLMLVGETPGNEEDRAGRPFVGPAGRLLRDVMAEVGLDPHAAYLTNAVKHFKWKPQGDRGAGGTPEGSAQRARSASKRGQEGTKRRLHQKPSAREAAACSPWLAAELAVVKPEILVLLGATAAQAVMGKSFRVTKERGELLTSPVAPHVLATFHPSAILRAPDRDARREMRELFTRDLEKIAALLRHEADARR